MPLPFPWPESPERVERRLHGLVASLLSPAELCEVRLEWVTPRAHHFDLPEPGWVALRLTVVAIDDEVFQKEIWGPEPYRDWEAEIHQLSSDLEDWVCETRFGWGQQRLASVPD
ncbi:hypothetical protein KVF89_06300 [Nocardioides carbamazepini]|uniref:hypothetical protein n=1 Tax=Nocardioides carbamazepini TaxID=2854259 RepID=UPI002149CDDF|nr:hypothetical protein [Nocardioides carbamazepini]MCR1782137.1 hypothetical protein [Nocardioides carbamazepini]